MRRRTLAAIVLVIVVGLALARVVIREDEEAPSVLVDERFGILHGVQFGDSEPEVRQLGDIRVFFGADPIESITLTRNGP